MAAILDSAALVERKQEEWLGDEDRLTLRKNRGRCEGLHWVGLGGGGGNKDQGFLIMEARYGVMSQRETVQKKELDSDGK